MSTTALHPTTATSAPPVPTLARVGAGLALPLGLMNCVGLVIFWSWGWDAWVGVLGAAMALATLAGAIGTLLGRPAARELLAKAMLAQMGYTVIKLVGWQEPEALTFGAVAAVIYALVRARG
jgi:hypothetical protein